jgi:preprotein translocase subunit Sec63
MPYTWEDFRRDYTREHLDLLTADEILRRFSADEILRRFSADEILQGPSAGEVLRRFSAEEIKAYREKLEKSRKRRKQ